MRLRYSDLKARGIVKNRVTLSNWQKKHGFPKGQMTGPNTRTWDEETEVNPWLASRPLHQSRCRRVLAASAKPITPGSRRDPCFAK